MTSRTLRRLIAVAFTASGFSALAYQVAWQRVLTQVIGSDAISVVFVVTIFMTCLGIGAELARRFLSKSHAPLALIYAAIEICVGLYGLLSIPLLRAANSWWATLGPSSVGMDAALNFLLLAPPVIGMGMTTPLIIHLARDRIDNLGRTVGWLYGLNILGASFGALISGLVLIEALGLRGTATVAALLNLFIGIALFVVLRRGDASPKSAPLLEPASVRIWHGLAAIAFGFGTLALQIALFRVVVNYFTMATIVFPLVLSAYLLLMAAGQWLGGRLADRYPEGLSAVLATLFASGSLLLLIAMRLPSEWAAWLGALTFTSFSGSLVAPDWPHLVGDPNPLIVFLFGGLLMLPVLAWSALFPVMTRLMTAQIEDAGKSFARLYSLYTVGNVLGTFAFGLWLLPSVGTGLSLIITAFVVAAGVLFVARLGSVRIFAITAAGLLLVLFIPRDYYRQFHLGDYAVEQVYEGRNGVATTVPTNTFYKIVDMNRTASASAMVRDPGLGDVYEAWRWNVTELMALDPGFRPRRILIIGIGHAYLIDALLDLPFVETIHIVDISDEVVEAVRANTKTSTRRIFEDSRVQIIIEDGRRFVQQALATGNKYDLIQTKINEPWHAGSGNLFTVEFMRLQRDLLTDGGYLGVRPLLGHARDGLQVFEAAIYPGYYHVYFKNGVLPLLDRATVTPDIFEAWYKRFPGHEEKTARSDRLKVLVLDKSSNVTVGDLNTDDRPTFEYYKLRQWLGIWESPRKSLSDADFTPMQRVVPVELDID